MIVITHADKEQFSEYGHDLFTSLRNSYLSFEGVAQAVCESFYTTFVTDTGDPAFALVRIFRSMRYAELPSIVRADLQHPDRNSRWLALMGTMGFEEDWRYRYKSRFHQAIQITEDISPMFKAAYGQLSLDKNVPWDEPDMKFEGKSIITRYLHIKDPVESGLVPDIESFVIPYGIQSVLGVGNRFLSGSVYILVAFGRIPLNSATAQRFGEMTPYISSLLGAYDGTHKLWEDQDV